MTAKIYERLSTVYDLDWGKWSRQYIAIIQEMLAQLGISRAKILDLACGTGTLALELAKFGHSVLGVDISPKMIEVAKSKAGHLSNVSFQVSDMLDFTTEEEFECVTCTFDSLNYLQNIDQLQAVIEKVGRALRPDGFFIFDCNTEQLYLTRHKGTHQRELGGQSFLQKLHYDPKQRIATTVFEFSDGTEEVHTQRPYNLDEIRPILAKEDLIVVRTISGFHGKPYTSESERLICITRKQKLGNL
ncbi:MAG: class I SAM-dependent methyltransferase [Spirochaetales bacterium]|nr:class I SAM-dependent methyltransferase [Spirochaetales bacterium]